MSRTIERQMYMHPISDYLVAPTVRKLIEQPLEDWPEEMAAVADNFLTCDLVGLWWCTGHTPEHYTQFHPNLSKAVHELHTNQRYGTERFFPWPVFASEMLVALMRLSSEFEPNIGLITLDARALTETMLDSQVPLAICVPQQYETAAIEHIQSVIAAQLANQAQPTFAVT